MAMVMADGEGGNPVWWIWTERLVDREEKKKT
jgi:hypothetical protein